MKTYEDAPRTLYEILYTPDQTPIEPGIQWVPNWYLEERNNYISRPAKEAEILECFQTRKGGGQRSRLVTIRAEGGMGKTRLAVACAVKMSDLFPDRIIFVSLAPLGLDEKPKAGCEDAAGTRAVLAVAEAIGSALGLEGLERLPDELLRVLQPRETLLIFDNYESVHGHAVALFLNRLATETRGVRLLVTSRVPVGIDDLEQTVNLEDGMTEAEARDLFLARAQLKMKLLGPLTPAEEAAISRIVALTECIPLALELAAAWVGQHSPKAIADGLEATPLERWTTTPARHIRSDSEHTGQRHDSLVRSLDWSYDRLAETAGAATSRVFAASGLFADSFDARGLAAITEHLEIDDALQALHEFSLIRRVEDRDTGEDRYRLHRFTRAYARHRLEILPNREAMRQRYVAYYVTVVDQNATMTNDRACLARLDKEWRNVLAALDLAESSRDIASIRTMALLTSYFDARSRWAESERLCNQVRSIYIKIEDRFSEGVTLNNLGNVYQSQGRWAAAITVLNAALPIRRGFRDRCGEGQTLNNVGIVYQNQGRWNEAIVTLNEALSIRRDLGDRRGEGQTLNNLAVVYTKQGRWAEATAAYEADLSICRDLGDRRGEGQTLNNLAVVYTKQRRWAEAIITLNAVLAIYREFGDRLGEGNALNNLGGVYKSQGQWSEAIAAFNSALAIRREFGDRLNEGFTLENLAWSWEHQGEIGRAIACARDAVTALNDTEAQADLENAHATLARLEARESGSH